MKRLDKYSGINSYDIAKSIAIIAMIIDHVGMFFFPHSIFLRVIGRISFPIFLFLIGYSQKFISKLDIILLMILMMALDWWLSDTASLITIYTNSTILPAIVLARLFYHYANKWVKTHIITSFCLLALYHLPINLFIQYGTIGCMFIIYGDLRRNNINNWQSHLFLALAITLHTYLTVTYYSPLQTLVLAVLMLGVSAFMIWFKVESYALKNALVKWPILISSRYSLYIYCIHFQLFKLMSL